MQSEFWLERWREGRTGFHMDRVMPLLEKHCPSLGVPRGSRVLVPLCGKSLDMLWLAAQGYRVLGVELSQLAVDAFLAEHALRARVHDSPLGTHHVAGDIEIIRGDVFDLDAATLASCSGVYDRAALVALPSGTRARYVEHVYGQLPDGFRVLLITLDYDQAEMEGPPFAVSGAEVRRLFGGRAGVMLVEERDILAGEPGFRARGLTRMETAVYHIQGRQGGAG